MTSEEILQALRAGKISLEDAKKALTGRAIPGPLQFTETSQGTTPAQGIISTGQREQARTESPQVSIHTEQGEQTKSAQETRRKEGIAIVGMSGRYPDASNLTAYWDNLVQAKKCHPRNTSCSLRCLRLL